MKSKNSIGKQITNAIWNILFTIILVIFPVFELVSYINAKDNLWKQKYIETIKYWNDGNDLEEVQQKYTSGLKQVWGLERIIAKNRTIKEQKIFNGVISDYKDIEKDLYILDGNKMDGYRKLIKEIYIYRTTALKPDAKTERELKNKIIGEI